jgi:hypothetical protein
VCQLGLPIGVKHVTVQSPILPDTLDHSGGLFFRNEGVPKYVPQVLIMYAEKRTYIVIPLPDVCDEISNSRGA